MADYSVKKNGEFEPVIRMFEALPAMEEYTRRVAVAFADWFCNGVSNRDRKLPEEMYDDWLTRDAEMEEDEPRAQKMTDKQWLSVSRKTRNHLDEFQRFLEIAETSPDEVPPVARDVDERGLPLPHTPLGQLLERFEQLDSAYQDSEDVSVGVRWKGDWNDEPAPGYVMYYPKPEADLETVRRAVCEGIDADVEYVYAFDMEGQRWYYIVFRPKSLRYENSI